MIRDYNSRKKDNFPIDGIYLVEFNIYEATISITNQTKIWLGLTKGTTIIKYCFAQKRRSMTLTYHNIYGSYRIARLSLILSGVQKKKSNSS